MASDTLRKNITFWGMVGGVMTALKLKDRWDDYRKVPNEEDGLGPVALRSPVQESAELPEAFDTEIPMAHPGRKRKRDCCLCCGMRCGLFWKAFGIVCLIVLVWQGIKLAIWLLTPSPTGLEGMPKFSESLGCANAPYIYNMENYTYSVAVGPKGDHAVDLRRGAAVGTFTIAESPAGATDVSYELTLRTDDKSLLDLVKLQIPSPEDIADGIAHSQLYLITPRSLDSACMRFDVVVRVPTNLKKFSLMTGSAVQVQFDADAKISLDTMFITMYGTSTDNMLLPTTGIRAKELHLEATCGWLVGEAALVEKTYVTTQRGNAFANVKIYPVALDTEDYDTNTPKAALETTTGTGRTDIFYINPSDVPHRPIAGRHISTGNGDLYLNYKQADFNGIVEVKSKSYTATGVSNLFGGHNGTVGNAEGGDSVMAQSNSGWIGLYF